MKMFSLTFFVLLAAGNANGWFLGKEPNVPEWDKFSATFLKFNSLPLSIDEAKASGWVAADSCKDKSYFLGNRYILNNDPAVMLLFDSKGKIAGIQNGVPKSSATSGFFKKPYWVEDDSLLVITAYFVDPKVICDGGREESKYLGDSLYIQNGDNPSSLMKIPLKEEDIGKTKWVKGKCFYGMGQHYWYDISKNMNCDDFFPAFILYNGGKLNAFGWTSMGDFQGDRYEHPPQWALGSFFQSETHPSCLSNFPKLSTMHIYLQRRPYLNFC